MENTKELTSFKSKSFLHLWRGTNIFNGQLGRPVEIRNVKTTDYQIIIMPKSISGFIGEISVRNKASNSFIVYNSGSDAVTEFEWTLIIN